MIRTLATAGTVAACLAVNPARPPVTLTAAVPQALPHAGKPATTDFATLARTDPVAMLDAALHRYRNEVRGFRATLHKQERVGGTLHPPEVIRVAGREQPFAVLFLWESGAREAQVGGFSMGKIEGVLYAAGENDGNVLAWRPGALFAAVAPTAPGSSAARMASRYTATESGLGHILDRTRRAWTAARDAGRLTWKFDGTRPVPEVGGRVCHVITRTCQPPEADPFISTDPRPAPGSRPGDEFATVTVMIDAERWLQIGSEQRAANGDLLGAYYFRDVAPNPAFAPDQFTRAALRK